MKTPSIRTFLPIRKSSESEGFSNDTTFYEKPTIPNDYLGALELLVEQTRNLPQKEIAAPNGAAIFEPDPDALDPDWKQFIEACAQSLIDQWGNDIDLIDTQYVESLAHAYDATGKPEILAFLSQLAVNPKWQQKNRLLELDKRVRAARELHVGVTAAENFIGHQDIAFSTKQWQQLAQFKTD